MKVGSSQINNCWKRLWAVALVMLPLLVIVFIPRPPIGGAQFLIVPTIAFFCAIVIFSPFNIKSSDTNIRFVYPFLFLILLQVLLMTLSQYINYSEIRTTGIVAIFRPLLPVLLLFTGIIYAMQLSKKSIYKGLYFSAVIIILGQFVISFTQAIDLPLFTSLYGAEKSRAIGRIFRVTGSLENPNFFGFIIIQASLIILLLGSGKKKFIWLTIATLLILASGSRSQLLIFPVALLLGTVLSKPKIDGKLLLKSGVVMLSGFILLFIVIFALSDTLRYMAQIFILFQGDLSQISSIAVRFSMWESKWATFLNDPSLYKWFIGLGSRPEFRVADNDYFYMFWHYGAAGLIIHISIYVSLFYLVLKSWDIKLKSLALTSLVLLLIVGAQSETMGGWGYPLTVLFFVGLTFTPRSKSFTINRYALIRKKSK